VVKLKHFSGQLFSVSPGMVKVLRGLFTLNERIVMLGEWKHGFFSMTAVGATNVGSIQLAFDDSLQTNRWIRDPHGSYTEKCLLTNTLKHPPERLARLPHPVADGIVGPMHDIAVYDLIPINARSDKLVAAASNNPSAVTSADQQQQQQQLNDGERGKEFVKGDELGQFNLGSTVVLVFEAPRTGHEFYVRPNEKVQYGQPLFGKAKRI
jgi:phosphatidylserine decarboxylase